MAATGYTPISLYYSATASAVPLAGNLANGELALNTADMKLYAKNSSGVVTLLASNGSTGANVSSLSFGTTGLTPSTATTGAITVAGTLNVANGGTGLTSLTAGYIPYGNGTSALSSSSSFTFDGTKLAILSSSASNLQSIKSTSTTSQGSLLQLFNNTDTPLNFGVFGSTAGTFGVLGASTPFISTSASTLNFVNTNASGAFVWGAGSTPNELMRLNGTGLSINTTVSKNKLLVASSNANDTITLGSVSGSFQVTNSNTAYGLSFGVFSTGNPWIQSMRTDASSSVYDLCLNPSGGNVNIGATSNPNARKLSVNGIVSVQDGTNEQAFIYYTGSATQWVSSSTPQQFWVNGAQRFVFGTSGQFGVGASPSYGTAGQVLTSQGSGSAPTWSAVAGGSQAFVAFGTTGGF